MKKKRLSQQQVILRVLFMFLAVALVAWFFPHNESFRYEYEVGKPWRYGRLTAPYDFAIQRSDTAVLQMEDSIRRQIAPRFMLESAVGDSVLRQLDATHHGLAAETRRQLRESLYVSYAQGIMGGDDYQQLLLEGRSEVYLRRQGHDTLVNIQQLVTEGQLYEQLRTDSIHGASYTNVPLQRYIVRNLALDTLAMRIEYARLRQQVSSTTGIVLAESRIIDQGEIVTPHIFEILESYRREQLQRLSLSTDDTLMILARLALVALLLGSILYFLAIYRPWHYFDQTAVFIAVGAVALMFVLTALTNRMIVGGAYLVPIGITTILLSTFHGSRTAFFGHSVMAVLCSFIAPSHYEYLFIQSLVGTIIVFALKDGLRERRQLLHVCLFAGIGYTGLYALYTLATEGTLQNISVPILLMMLANAVLLLMAYLIIYILENVFGVVSDVSLNELCNLSQGLLQKLSQEATGTFNHCLNTANICSSAAKLIGANPALVRTGAYYHDIGKLWNPMMYTENQEGYNPHDQLATEESVEIIKRHVTEGVAMARKAKLPRDIINFITTHHGAAQVKYFFYKWCNAHPDEEPDMRLFSYPGPDPETKEQAILMLADGVEAATRSLTDYAGDSIAQRVNSVVDGIVASGHLNHAKITLAEIQVCKESFIHDLKAYYHARIEYPQIK